MKYTNRQITVKAIFDSITVDNVVSVTKVSLNSRLINVFDNCRVTTNNAFIFFKGLGESPKIYKCVWSYELELRLTNLI